MASCVGSTFAKEADVRGGCAVECMPGGGCESNPGWCCCDEVSVAEEPALVCFCEEEVEEVGIGVEAWGEVRAVVQEGIRAEEGVREGWCWDQDGREVGKK